MSSFRFFTQLVAICVVFLADGVNGCQDLRSWCPGNKQFCHTHLLMRQCPKTCLSCKPVECNACSDNCTVKADGTIQCTCYKGSRLTSDGKTCEDINECAENIAQCKEGEVCKNNHPDYECLSNFCSPFLKDNYIVSETYNKTCCKMSFGGQCGTNKYNNPGQKIIGGVDSTIESWPWQAFFILGNEKCGGSLINDMWIISAAHCFEKYNLSRIGSYNITVLLGLNDTTDVTPLSLQIRKVVEVISHPDYVFPMNDIALVRMHMPVTLGSNSVRPVCLPNGEMPATGTICHITGFGTTNPQSSNAAVRLQQAAVPLVDPEVCRLAYDNFAHNVDKEKMVCAGYKSGGVDSCRGDSGGPLVCQRCNSCDWFLVGVTSFGRGCADPDSYGVYTKVEFYEQWIASKISSVKVSKQTCESTAWSTWGQWGDCTGGCKGTQTRARQCKNGIPGIPGCIGKVEQKRECTVKNQRIWSKWSACSVSCGGGEQTRTRGCAPRETGKRNCNLQVCPTWSQWGKWSTCQKRCENEETTRSRTCRGGEVGDIGCEGPAIERKQCTKDPICTEWTQWSAWSQCSKSCGSGEQTSNRNCQGARGACQGMASRKRACNTNICAQWSQWLPWSQCSETCGSGTRSRTRSCQGGETCIGESTEEGTCIITACPVWSAWSEWSTCSSSCLGGTRTRSRTCGKGSSDAGKCSGPANENEACGLGVCNEPHNCEGQCLTYVSSGHCYLNPSWMSSFCGSDCCGEKVCRDSWDRCNEYGASYCSNTNFAGNCLRLCGWCG